VSERPETTAAQASRLAGGNQQPTGGTPRLPRREKILALQFKYFGDAVLLTPALRALRGHFPQAEIHLLAPEEIAPLFEHLPWLARVWAMPRRRGHASLGQTWPFLRALRREHFDRSVDFASNDRGAILSRLIGATRRLGWDEPGGFWGRRYCYTDRVAPETKLPYEAARMAQLLSGWQVPPPASLELEICADPALEVAAAHLLPTPAVLCHLAASQPNRQWPGRRWAELCQLAAAASTPLVFTTAAGVREQALTDELKQIVPNATVLPPMPDLALFLAVLKRAGIFVSGDTGPLHFAAGLGVPTISLFGPSDPERFAPRGAKHQFLKTMHCSCGPAESRCLKADCCLGTVTAEQVFALLPKAFAPK
jgi:ADP-heptose:LPS heptosyltransferase